LEEVKKVKKEILAKGVDAEMLGEVIYLNWRVWGINWCDWLDRLKDRYRVNYVVLAKVVKVSAKSKDYNRFSRKPSLSTIGSFTSMVQCSSLGMPSLLTKVMSRLLCKEGSVTIPTVLCKSFVKHNFWIYLELFVHPNSSILYQLCLVIFKK
jgi:hypothetical protein